MELTDEQREKYRARFSRWQMKTLEERGKFITLLLTLSLGTIAFVLNQIMKPEFSFKTSYLRVATFSGLVILLLCVIMGLLLSLNRLKDLRQTTHIAKERKDGKSEEEIKPFQEENDKVGKKTIAWLNRMVFMFILGEGLSLISLFLYLNSEI